MEACAAYRKDVEERIRAGELTEEEMRPILEQLPGVPLAKAAAAPPQDASFAYMLWLQSRNIGRYLTFPIAETDLWQEKSAALDADFHRVGLAKDEQLRKQADFLAASAAVAWYAAVALLAAPRPPAWGGGGGGGGGDPLRPVGDARPPWNAVDPPMPRIPPGPHVPAPPDYVLAP
jgi:hypothetical protein